MLDLSLMPFHVKRGVHFLAEQILYSLCFMVCSFFFLVFFIAMMCVHQKNLIWTLSQQWWKGETDFGIFFSSIYLNVLVQLVQSCTVGHDHVQNALCSISVREVTDSWRVFAMTNTSCWYFLDSFGCHCVRLWHQWRCMLTLSSYLDREIFSHCSLLEVQFDLM